MSNLKDKNILIVGLGMIGGSYAMGLNDKGITPYGFDLNLVTMEYAISNGIIKNEMCTHPVFRAIKILFGGNDFFGK